VAAGPRHPDGDLAAVRDQYFPQFDDRLNRLRAVLIFPFLSAGPALSPHTCVFRGTAHTVGYVLTWVSAEWVADELVGLPGVDVEVVALGRDMADTGEVSPVAVPASVADVEFYVPSFFPSEAASAVLGEMRALRVVQALTAGVDWLRPHVPPSVALCNARG